MVNYTFYDGKFSIGLVMGYAFALYVFLFVKAIFKKVRDKARIMINLVTIILVNIPYLVVQLNPDYSYHSSTNVELMMMVMVPLFLLVNLIINATFFIYLLVKRICACRSVEKKKE